MQKILTEVSSTLKLLSLDQIEAANSGHPGVALGLSDILSALCLHINLSPENPGFINRDRLIFSGGHASALVYSFYHLMGYDMSLEDLKAFRKLGSKTPGHPEKDLEAGIEITTGPLGQGIANAVGMAIAQRFYEKQKEQKEAVLDHKIYCFCGDGDMQEGIGYEAVSFAGHHCFNNLVLIYDCNKISIEGSIDIAFSDDVKARFIAQHWDVLEICGHNFDQINDAFIRVKKAEKPTLIIANTAIAKGAFEAEGSHKSHGAPLGKEMTKRIKASLGFDENKDFYVRSDVRGFFNDIRTKMRAKNEEFARKNAEFIKQIDLCKELSSTKLAIRFNISDAPNKKLNLEDLEPEELELNIKPFIKGQKISTRASNNVILNALASLPNFLGGSADLSSSNGADLKSGSFPNGQNIHFGIREHAMGAMTNGISAYGGLINFCATFFVFSDYLSHSIRLASLMKLRVMYIFTHDSIGVGEDGATHQPIEHLSHYRALPNLRVYRPMDGNENIACMQSALEHDGPSMFVLSRQNLEVLTDCNIDAAKHGFWVVRQSEFFKKRCENTDDALELFSNALDKSCCEQNLPKITLLASGSEVKLAIDAAIALEKEGYLVKVISVNCFSLMNKYLDLLHIELQGSKVLAIEASAGLEWFKVADDVICMSTFGASGNGDEVYAHFGFSVNNILKRAKRLFNKA
ncbi:MAG: transketolase [Helicobacter sp.]|nr:transketolase [Helicobacter sp.]